MNEQIGKMNSNKLWVSFSEQVSVKKLEGLGIKNIEFAFELTNESDLNGNRIEDEAEIFWVKFKPPVDFPKILPAEGKLYIPKGQKNKTLIHYAPSFPQGNAGRFEKRYVYDFIKAGYAFFAGRHNGTSITNTQGETFQEIFNAPRRIEIGNACNEGHIGGTRSEGYLPSEMNNEPVTSLSALAPAFDKIQLIAQSLGASAHYNAVTKLKTHPEILNKLGNIISIAGYVGKDKESSMGVWDGTNVPAQGFADYQLQQIKNCDLNFTGDSATFLSDMRKIAKDNARIKIPYNVGNIFFFTPKDPFIAGPRDTTLVSLDDYGPKTPRKLIISDERIKDNDKRPHSMDWITSGDIIAAMNTQIPEGDPLHRHLSRGELFVA